MKGSPINVSGPIMVDVIIDHTYRGDLSLHLIAPDGTSYLVMARPVGDSGDDVRARFTIYNAIGELTTGPWKLMAQDWAAIDSGAIEFVGLHF